GGGKEGGGEPGGDRGAGAVCVERPDRPADGAERVDGRRQRVADAARDLLSIALIERRAGCLGGPPCTAESHADRCLVVDACAERCTGGPQRRRAGPAAAVQPHRATAHFAADRKTPTRAPLGRSERCDDTRTEHLQRRGDGELHDVIVEANLCGEETRADTAGGPA